MARVLLMEDDLPLALEMASGLQQGGHDVSIANSAAEARKELWHWDFDILITDIIVRKGGRPVGDAGLGLIGWVRHTAITTPGLKYLPVIAISAEQGRRGMDFILPTADRIGADRVFEKPVNMADLLTEVDLLTQSDPTDMAGKSH